LAIAITSLGHPNDPKRLDRIPPYDGPGYRAGEGGVAGGPTISFPSSGVQLLSWITVPEFGAGNSSANVVWGYVSPSGREYALVGLSGGTGFVDVTNPSNPEIVDFVSGPASIWRDIKVYQHYAYAVSEGGSGIQVMDLAQIDQGDVALVGTVTTGGSSSTHTLALNEASGYLYRAGGSGNGLRIYSLANPALPVFVAEWQDRYVHEAQIYSYTSGKYAGREIAFCCGGFNGGGVQTGLSIVDVTDKDNIEVYTHYEYPGAAYSHQGWLSPDEKYFYLDDEFDEEDFGLTSTTHVIDVQDLHNPFQADTFTNGSTSIDHNLYIRDDGLIFEANYRSGLRVFDPTDDPFNPVQIGFFDTWPEDDNSNFNGLWSNYPFLPSGIVLGSDIEKGLFVWHVGPPLLGFSYPNGLPEVVSPKGDSITVKITSQDGTLAPGSAMIHYDLGNGLVDAPLEPLGGELFEAALPAVACGSEVSYFFTALTTNEVLVRDPATTYGAASAYSFDVPFADNMTTDTGWTIGAPGDNAVTGIWVRVDPNGTGAQPEDDNPSGEGVRCYVTGQGAVGAGLGSADVDAGITTLTSPVMDSTGGDIASIVYYRWYSNNLGQAPGTDSMPIHISNDNGQTWVLLEDVNENAAAWVRRSFLIEDFVEPTNQMRIRFIARDLGEGSLVEAGVDDVSIVLSECDSPVLADLDGNGVVDGADLGSLLLQWGECATAGAACPADLSEDGVVDGADLGILLLNWTG